MRPTSSTASGRSIRPVNQGDAHGAPALVRDPAAAAFRRPAAFLLAPRPEDREAPVLDCEVVQVRLSELTLHDPRQWGACWLALTLWERLELDRFWGPRLPASREGTRWLDMLKIQVCCRLIDPGSDWRLQRP